jgi:hypothetical protein
MTTTKAVRATITLGDIELDVFQLPDESYRYSLTQAFISIANEDYDTKQASKRYIEICNSKKAQHLAVPTLQTYEKTKIEGENQVVKLISQADVMSFWAMAAFLGHSKAFGLIVACGIEALERRADAAFNVKRTEEEYNQRLVIRRDGIISRYFWTDVIDEYLRTHEVSNNYKRFIYIHVSDMVNNAVLGMTAKQFRESQGLPDGITTRDYCTTAQLKQIDTIENAAAMRVKKNDVCPKQALKDVISLIC